MEQHIEEVTENVHQYLNTRYELLVLKASEKTSTLAAEMIAMAFIAFMALFAVLFLSFTLAYYYSTAQHEGYLGFLIVGGGYFAIGLLAVCFRKSLLTRPLRNKIISQLFSKDNA